LPFAGAAPRSFATLRVRHPSGRQRFWPRYRSNRLRRYVSAKLKHLLRMAAARSAKNHLRHNRRNPTSILHPPNAPTIFETQAMPNPKSITL